MKQRIMFLLLMVCMIATLIPHVAMAQDGQSDKGTSATTASSAPFLALGDSISTGYGLDESEYSFLELFAQHLMPVNNQAVNGAKMGDLKTLVTGGTIDTDILAAKIITITMGGNDLMEVLYGQTAFNLNKTVEETKELLAAGNVVTMMQAIAVINQLATGTGLDATITSFQADLLATIQYIKAKNSRVQILVCTQYQPYQWLEAFNVLNPNLEQCVEKLNSVIRTNATGYKVADVHAAFAVAKAANRPTLTNVSATTTEDVTTYNLDFHPNKEGHAQIWVTIGEVLPGLVRYKNVENITQNGVTATVSYDLPEPQLADTAVEVKVTVALSGMASKTGNHTINLTSNTATFTGGAQSVAVTQNTSVNYTGTYTVSTPVSLTQVDITPTLTHSYVPTYSISGKVTNSAAVGLAAATLQLKKGTSNVGAVVTTDAEGAYTIHDVTADSYTIEVSCVAYTTTSIDVTVETEDITNKHITLQKIPVSITGSVAITGNPTYGGTLTATATNTPQDATLLYRWTSGTTILQQSESNTYKIEGTAVGAVITVTVTATDYTNQLTQTTTTVVAKKEVTAQAAVVSKTYDGSTAAAVSLSIDPAVKINTSDVINITAQQAVYDNANVGIDKAITLGPLAITGAAANWYTVSTPIGVTGQITVQPITVTPSQGQNTTYDGSTPVINYTYGGNVLGETPQFRGALAISGTDVGTYDITLGDLVLVGDTSFIESNYTLAFATIPVTYTIAKAATPNITYPTATAIIYGDKLATSPLIGGSTTFGTFAWKDGNSSPTVTNSGYAVTFTPSADTEKNYNAITDTEKLQAIVVNKATPAISIQATVSGTGANCQGVLTAMVSKVKDGDVPSGTVQFKDTTNASVNLSSPAAIVNGTATYTWTGMKEGALKATATYNGNENYNDVTSTELSFDTIKARYTVRFNTNGGSLVSDIGNVPHGGTVTKPSNPTRNGYNFANWCKDNTQTNLWDFASDTVTANITLYAKWTPTNPGSTQEKPTITTGNQGSSRQEGSGTDMTFICSGKLEDLTGIYVDGIVVDATNYRLKSGSTILTLKASYLDALSVGRHTLKFQYKDNVSAETQFSTTTKAGNTVTLSSPRTGNSNHFRVLFALLLASGGIFTGLFIKGKRTSRYHL